MVYHSFEGNTLERNGPHMLQHLCLSERCCPKEKNLKRITVKTASHLSWPVSMTKTIHRNKPDSEADIRLHVSPIILRFKIDVFMKTASSITPRNLHIIIVYFYWLIYLQWGYCILFAYKQKKWESTIFITRTTWCVLPTQIGWGYMKYFSLEKGSTNQKFEQHCMRSLCKVVKKL